MTKKSSTRKTRGKGTKLAGSCGCRSMRGKGFMMDVAKSQGPQILGSILGEIVKMGLSKAISKK